jgi:hypothetical protein
VSLPCCRDSSPVACSLQLPVLQHSAPQPTNRQVFLSETPSFEAYVASYSGWNSAERFTKAAADLLQQLHEQGIQVREDMYYTAGYDSPFRLFNRHNEVCKLLSYKFSSLCCATVHEAVFSCVRGMCCLGGRSVMRPAVAQQRHCRELPMCNAYSAAAVHIRGPCGHLVVAACRDIGVLGTLALFRQ